MSVSSRPMSRVTIGESYYELIDSYESVLSLMKQTRPEDHIEVTNWSTQKPMTIRVGSIDTVQKVGF